MAARNKPEAIYEKIDLRGPDECWPWMGRLTLKQDGYGYIGIGGKEYVAHRVAFALANPGKIEFAAPKNKSEKGFVLHSCDNRICCNPSHLFLGSYDDNNKDASRKWRSGGGCQIKGEDHHLAVTTKKSSRRNETFV